MTIPNVTSGQPILETWGDAVADLLNAVAGAEQVAIGTTTSTSFSQTLGGSPGTNPAVTITTGTSVLIAVSAQITITVANYGFVGVDVSGATTIAASDVKAAGHGGVAGLESVDARMFFLSGLTPGSNTFTLTYKVNAGTGTFLNRSLFVRAL